MFRLLLVGNANIHRITSQGDYELKYFLEDFEGNTRYALDDNFSLTSEQDYYRLSIGNYSDNAGSSLYL